MRARLAAAAAALVAAGAFVMPALAQGVAGTVRDSISKVPLPGVVVMALDSALRPTARTLTDERGVYRLRLTEAARTLRAVRIGFAPRERALPALAAGAQWTLDLDMAEVPNMLGTVHVRANSLCPSRSDRANALGLWEQARSGLLATVVAREANPATLRRLGYERVMEGNSDRIESMRVRDDSADAVATSFFAAHTADDLVRFGFSTDSTGAGTFFGPDADVLLDPSFAAAYCFGVTRGGRERPEQVGLHFAPAQHHRGRVDIDGTLWIDTAARALTDIEFRYLGLSYGAMRLHPGGRISFRAMPNGVVLIDRWSLRLVSASRDSVVDAQGILRPRDWLYADDTGGELASARWPDGTVWSAPLGALRVTAVGHDGQPAAGTVLALAATSYFGIADRRGVVDIRDLLPGPYIARIIDPRVAPLGIGLPTSLKFVAARDTTTVARLLVPTPLGYAVERCVAAGSLRSGTAPGGMFALLGRVLTADGRPVRDARVSIATKTVGAASEGSSLTWLREDDATGADGIFQACHQWSLHDTVVIRVRVRGVPEIETEREFGKSDLIVVKVLEPDVPPA